MTLAEILNEIQRLPLADRKTLQDQLATEAATDVQLQEQPSLDEFYQSLFDEGFLVNLPADLDRENFEPIAIKGKPLSETIIEERR
ncbi:MAG: hypothetical protein ABIP75_16860 [Pyrinomonadaceae bacterium]